MSPVLHPAKKIMDRFFRKVYMDPNCGCWIWTGAVYAGGYGVMMADKVRYTSSRFAYMALRGPIPHGFDLDHLCRNRVCVNPYHLEPVTRRENLVRGKTLIASQVSRTHCPRGHPYSGDNLVLRKRGSRECRTCVRYFQAIARSRRAGKNGTL